MHISFGDIILSSGPEQTCCRHLLLNQPQMLVSFNFYKAINSQANQFFSNIVKKPLDNLHKTGQQELPAGIYNKYTCFQSLRRAVK